jgi:hypothetical protein
MQKTIQEMGHDEEYKKKCHERHVEDTGAKSVEGQADKL